MAKGIRSAVNNHFIAMSAKRLAGEFGDTSGTLAQGNVAFRAEVVGFAIDTFGIKLTSASTAYNHAFKHASKYHPELVAGLGRAADKKGGRKAGVKNTDSTVAEETAEVVVEVKTYTVSRKKDGVVQGTGLTLEEAEAMVAKAVKGKKATLVIA